MLLGLLVMLVPLVSFMLLSVASFAEADSSESLSASRTSFRPDAAAAAVLQDVSGLDNNGKVSVGGSDFSRLRAIACRNVTAGKGMVGDESGAAG